ncbi:MAG: type II secretion system minor pseudopilin GspK [Zetaproteobacteria bacterium]|nr:type II secretion system minor pseudopilin GspK [Zetaproteobacteria bacterium]
MPVNHERGIALIVVLALVALISTWAVTAAYEDMIALRRAENMVASAKAHLASESAMNLARLGLREDARLGGVDDLTEQWAQEAPPFPVDGGMLSGQIIDMNRLINLNDLVDDQGGVHPTQVVIVKRLFTLLELDPSLVDALCDWLDSDQESTGAMGAEDSAYYAQDYRVKNARLDHLNELLLVKGFDRKTFEKLSPFVGVWPIEAGALSPININTASPQVLQALFPNMLDADAMGVVDGRPYDSLTLLQQQPWALGDAGANFVRLTVSSGYFRVQTDALFDRSHCREVYILQRMGTAVTVIERMEL